MTSPPDLPYRAEAPVSRRPAPRRRPPFGIGDLTRRDVVRILTMLIGAAIYLPAMVLMTIQAAGPDDLQMLFDWLRGQCGAGCSGREVLATVIQIAPIVVTAPVLVGIGILWVVRGRRSDRQVKAISSHFDKAPDRVSPYAVDMDDDDDRYLYRDRRGRLRPVHAPPSPAAAEARDADRVNPRP